MADKKKDLAVDDIISDMQKYVGKSFEERIKKYEDFYGVKMDENINFYPLRNKIENILIKNSHKYNLKILNDSTINNSVYVNEDLSRLINESYLTVACSSITDALFHKHLEISASNSVILGEYPKCYEELFKENIIEINEFMSEEEILNIIDNALFDKNKLNEISERLYKIVHTEHNLDKATENFDNINFL